MNHPGGEARPGNEELVAAIASEIRTGGPISFARFMHLALNHPAYGYYSTGPERIGRSGDFITSPEVSAVFGECIAAQILEMDRLLDGGPLTLVELGPGTGRLAEDILTALRAGDRGTGAADRVVQRLTFILVESSAGLRAAQRARLEDRAGGTHIAWARAVEEAVALAGGKIRGVVLSNEFFDVLPVHVVVRREGTLYEKHVGISDDAFDEVLVPVGPGELLDYATRYGVAPADGMEAEIGLEAMRVAGVIADGLEAGFHMAIDYGDEAKTLYSRLRPRGTLLSYSGHRTNERFLDRPGMQDITAHVNFTALIDAGQARGLRTAGLTTQDRFLLAFGIADRIATLAASTDPADIRRRLSLMMLIHPEGMGRTFKILLQHKGLAKPPALTGLTDPFSIGHAEAEDDRVAGIEEAAGLSEATAPGGRREAAVDGVASCAGPGDDQERDGERGGA